jgi:hypothetical protein
VAAGPRAGRGAAGGRAAIVAATDAPAVTGSANVDRVWAAAYAVGLTIGASRSRRWTWLGLGAAALGTGGAVGVAAGFVALAAAVVGAARARAVGRIGALVGASAAVALLRWDAGPPWVAAAAATAAAVIVLPALALTRAGAGCPRGCSAPRGRRGRHDRWAGAEAIQTRTRLDLAAGRLDAAVAAAADGRAGDAAPRFELAAQAFGGARAAARSPALWPLRFVPVIGTARPGGRDGRRIGPGRVARRGHRGPRGRRRRPPARRRRARPRRGGRHAPLLADLCVRLASSLDAVGDADSPWLLPSVGHRLDQVTSRLRSLAHGADLGASATEVLPTCSAAAGPRTYLVGFTTPAEARGLGGFLANYAEIEADEGQLRLVRTGPVSDLSDALPPDPTCGGSTSTAAGTAGCGRHASPAT